VKRNNRTFLELETLENRWLPASVTFVSGYLIIQPSSGEAALNLTVTQSSPNHFTVKDGASTLGTFGPVSNIDITGGNGADSITVNLNALTYTGNIQSINTGNGNDSVSITGGGAILGSTNIQTGAGNDSVSLASTTPTTFGGPVQLTDTLGINTATVGGAGSTFGGDVTIQGYQNTTLGAGSDSFNGNVTIQNNFLAGNDSITINVAVIQKSLNVSTGAGSDLVTVTKATVNGSTQFNLGEGNDTFTATGGANVSFNGNFSFNDGSGNDSVSVTAGATFGGMTTRFTLGDGTDTVNMTGAATSVFGDLAVTLGSGNDSVTVDATVFGGMRWNLGNGNDTVTIGNAPGSTLFWNSGNGNDSVTFGDATNSAGETWTVNMRFGTGNDTLTLAGNGTVASPEGLTGFIDMGGPPGGNQFDPTGSLAAGTWVTIQPFTIQNV
jgi:hypothetical protein